MVSGLIQIVVILLSGAGFDFTGSLVGFSRFDYWSFGEGWLIVAVERVHEELVGAVRLCAPLWLESVEKDMPFAVGHFDGGSLALDLLRMQEHPAFERVGSLGDRRRESRRSNPGFGSEGRPAFEHDDGVGGQVHRGWDERRLSIQSEAAPRSRRTDRSSRPARIFVTGSPKRSITAEERLVEGDERAALPDKFAEGIDTCGVDAAGIFAGDDARFESRQ